MTKTLSTKASTQLTRNDILGDFDIFIQDVKCNDVISYSRDFNRDFGCATFEIMINNDNGVYSIGGSKEISLHDDVRLVEKYAGATDTFKNFHGLVIQRNVRKSSNSNNINITCLDYIVELQNTDIDKNFEAQKYLVVNETLTPVYLSTPNQMFASLFNFANTNLALDPPVSIRIKNKDTLVEDPQWSGYELDNEAGQLQLGAVLNALDNYDIISTYYFYPKGLYAEDIIEEILTKRDGYGNFLFGESTAQGVIDNHLTETLNDVDGTTLDPLAHWKMNDNAANTAVNDSIGNNIGTAEQNTEDITITGKINNALDFNGTSDKIDYGAFSDLKNTTNAFSFCIWAKKDSKTAGRAGAIMGNWYWVGDAQARRGAIIRWFVNSDLLSIIIETTNGSLISEQSATTTASSLTDWYFIVGTWDGSTREIKIYLNAVLKTTTITPSGYTQANLNSPNNLVMGYSNINNAWFDGKIDDVRVYDYALSLTQIETLYNHAVGTENELATDTLTRNEGSIALDMETIVTTASSTGDTTLKLETPAGWPNTGNATSFSVNGDTVTYNTLTGSTLYGIPATGGNAIQAHPVGSYATYSATFPVNQVWSLTYDNHITTLNSGADFTIPAGASIRYIDKRFGRIVFDLPIASDSTVTCNNNYSFKTLQATGIEITNIKFKEKNDKSRFDALTKLRNLIPPNYLMRTIGDDKIWATYINQKTIADYTLKSIKSIDYGEDKDVYTRTVFYGKNRNPHNVFFDSGVSFESTGNTYTATTTNTELSYAEDDGPYRVYVTGLSTGCIRTDTVTPQVFINDVPIDNNVHEIIMSQTLVTTRSTTTTTTEEDTSQEPEVTTYTYYNYTVHFSHKGIIASETILLYNPNGTLIYTLGPNDSKVDYENGRWSVPGSEQNSTVETVSTASYWVMYSTDDIQIDYANARFKINKRLVPNAAEIVVSATFEYQTVSQPIENAYACFDGRWDTQTQTVFYAKPPSGYQYAIIDLGSIKSIQLIDIIAGFFKPDLDGRRKFEMTNQVTLKYSYDNEVYYNISSETTYFALISGKTKTFDEKVLGEDFRARYFKLIIEDMGKIPYTAKGMYAISLVEIAAYSDVVLRGEAKLIPTTELTASYDGTGQTLSVLNTSSFPSGAGFLHINSGSGLSTSSLWFSGKTSTSFTGCTGASGMGTYASGTQVYHAVLTDTTFYDEDYLLLNLGDVVFKNTTVNEYLDTQEKVDDRAKDWLREFYKNHTALEVGLIYGPHYQIGNTVTLDDPYNRVTNENYFIERISSGQSSYVPSLTLTVAKYPG